MEIHLFFSLKYFLNCYLTIEIYWKYVCLLSSLLTWVLHVGRPIGPLLFPFIAFNEHLHFLLRSYQFFSLYVNFIPRLPPLMKPLSGPWSFQVYHQIYNFFHLVSSQILFLICILQIRIILPYLVLLHSLIHLILPFSSYLIYHPYYLFHISPIPHLKIIIPMLS